VGAALDLCTVSANIQTYARQQIRLTAFLEGGYEGTVLYDPKCQNGSALVDVSFGSKVTGHMRALRRIVRKKHHALVTIEGTMRGPEPLKVDPQLPEWIKDRFKGSMKRYGHMGSLEMMIEVAKVIDAKDMDDGLAPNREAQK
jgi:hypothetical protein